MPGIRKIEMSHFPGRLNMGIGEAKLDYNNQNEIRWEGHSILEHYLNESIIMTGKYCADYAQSVGCNEDVINNIADSWGHLDRNIKQKLLNPIFKIDYKEIHNSEKLADVITITFPNVCMEIREGSIKADNIENLADLILKAGIKSVSDIKCDKFFSIQIFRVNTNCIGFQKQGYADIPHRNQKDLDELFANVYRISSNKPYFIYFYWDKWKSHYSNIDSYE